MVRARKATHWRDLEKTGIHVFNPTKSELEQAKEHARINGFKTVWVHRKRLRKVI